MGESLIKITKESRSELIRYDAACRALADAKATDEVQEIRNQSEAMRAYARQAKNRQLEVDAAEIRIRAERRLGELIRKQKETVGMNQGASAGGSKDGPRGAFVEPRDTRPTLADAGIDKKLSSRAQKYAAFSEEEFQGMVDSWREGILDGRQDRVTVNLAKEIMRVVSKGKAEKESQAAALPSSRSSRFVTNLEALAGEEFSCLYVDPPWRYSNQATRASTSNHYSTLTVEELCEFPVPKFTSSNCYLHLWTTNAFLFECPRIFAAWGFEFKSSLVWVKPQFGIGNYWRNAHEFLLLGVKGNPARRAADLKSWVEAPRTQHSSKPEVVRDLIEKFSDGPYLELFGRRKIKGWTVFGNEINA